jgi:hypothetical protein
MKKPPADYSKGGFCIGAYARPYPAISAKCLGRTRMGSDRSQSISPESDLTPCCITLAYS